MVTHPMFILTGFLNILLHKEQLILAKLWHFSLNHQKDQHHRLYPLLNFK